MTSIDPIAPPEGLAELRAELDAIDAALIATMAERQRIVASIGALKQAHGRQLRDYRREAQVLANVRARAAAHGLSADIAERVMLQLIESSLTAQEQTRVKNSGQGQDKCALILGGNGKMGRWFASFLDAQGYEVVIADPSGAPDGFRALPNWHVALAGFDLIVIAAPLQISAALLRELTAARAQLKAHALVFDIGSLKSPLKAALREAAAVGLPICSVHPMFGPDTVLLADRHVIFIDVGQPQAAASAKTIFQATSAGLVDMTLDEHDVLISYVLGLSHALNICFFSALADSGAAADRLMALSSTTFDRQLRIAQAVAQENPALYFEIQHLNDERELMLQAFERAVSQLSQLVRAGDAEGFTRMMQRGRSYLSQRVVAP
jgi:chorismate mutase / prephenate dehydrogenase